MVKVLQFSTGSSCVPLGGFKNLAGPSGPSTFTIQILTDTYDTLPRATTWYYIRFLLILASIQSRYRYIVPKKHWQNIVI